MQPIYGGAAAKPFVTHHNQLKQDLYLRISFELYLKRLLVGGLERVYEIGRDFRNEGVDRTHNPEFTQLEFYWAYADYLQVMEFTEKMLAFVAEQVTGGTTIEYQGQVIDLGKPWQRVELREGLLERSGIDLSQYPDATSLAKAIKAKGLEADASLPRGKLVNLLMDEFLEPTLVQPDLLIQLPARYFPAGKKQAGRSHDRGEVRRFRRRDGTVQCLHRTERSAGPGAAFPGNGARVRRRRG